MFDTTHSYPVAEVFAPVLSRLLARLLERSYRVARPTRASDHVPRDQVQRARPRSSVRVTAGVRFVVVVVWRARTRLVSFVFFKWFQFEIATKPRGCSVRFSQAAPRLDGGSGVTALCFCGLRTPVPQTRRATASAVCAPSWTTVATCAGAQPRAAIESSGYRSLLMFCH